MINCLPLSQKKHPGSLTKGFIYMLGVGLSIGIEKKKTENCMYRFWVNLCVNNQF